MLALTRNANIASFCPALIDSGQILEGLSNEWPHDKRADFVGRAADGNAQVLSIHPKTIALIEKRLSGMGKGDGTAVASITGYSQSHHPNVRNSSLSQSRTRRHSTDQARNSDKSHSWIVEEGKQIKNFSIGSPDWL